MATARGRTVESRGVPRSAVAGIGLGLFGLGLSVGGYGAAVSLLIGRGVPPDAAGLGTSLFLLGQLLAVVPADLATRSRPVERVAAVGLAVAAVGIAAGSSPSLAGQYASRSLLGLGQGAAFVAGMKYVGVRTAGSDTAAAQGLLGALFTLGLAAGLAATPAVVAGGALAAHAALAAAVALLGAGWTARLPTAGPSAPVEWRSYLDAFATPSGVVLGLGNVATFGFLMVAATWYADVLGRTALPATAVLVGFALATVLGRAAGGALAGRLGERATVRRSIAGLAVVLGGLAAAVAADSAAGVAAGLVATGLGFGVPFGPLFALAFSELADDPGVTLAGMLVVGNGGALVYPWLVGRLLAATAGYAAGFAAMAVSVGLVWLCWVVALGR